MYRKTTRPRKQKQSRKIKRRNKTKRMQGGVVKGDANKALLIAIARGHQLIFVRKVPKPGDVNVYSAVMNHKLRYNIGPGNHKVFVHNRSGVGNSMITLKDFDVYTRDADGNWFNVTATDFANLSMAVLARIPPPANVLALMPPPPPANVLARVPPPMRLDLPVEEWPGAVELNQSPIMLGAFFEITIDLIFEFIDTVGTTQEATANMTRSAIKASRPIIMSAANSTASAIHSIHSTATPLLVEGARATGRGILQIPRVSKEALTLVLNKLSRIPSNPMLQRLFPPVVALRGQSNNADIIGCAQHFMAARNVLVLDEIQRVGPPPPRPMARPIRVGLPRPPNVEAAMRSVMLDCGIERELHGAALLVLTAAAARPTRAEIRIDIADEIAGIPFSSAEDEPFQHEEDEETGAAERGF